MAYLLDADVFIRAKNLHYGLDFCPGFWDWLVAGNDSGRVFSIEKVGDEVQAGADELSDLGRRTGVRVLSAPRPIRLPGVGGGQRVGKQSGLRTGSSQHVPAGGRLLARRAGTGWGAHSGDARDTLRFDSKNQDSQCLYRARHTVHDPVRDAP